MSLWGFFFVLFFFLLLAEGSFLIHRISLKKKRPPTNRNYNITPEITYEVIEQFGYYVQSFRFVIYYLSMTCFGFSQAEYIFFLYFNWHYCYVIVFGNRLKEQGSNRSRGCFTFTLMPWGMVCHLFFPHLFVNS